MRGPFQHRPGRSLAHGSTPVPERDTASGVAVALVAMFSLAVLMPAVVGLKLTAMLQEDPAASVAGQVLDFANELALVPVMPMPRIEYGNVPLFERVAFSTRLVPIT